MKNIKLYAYVFAALMSANGLTSCLDMLEEEPRTQLTVDYLKTQQGLESAVVSAYSGLRWLYGPDGPLCFSVLGTDEFIHTEQIGANFKYLDTFTQLSPGNVTATFWDNGLQFINTCNSVVDYSEEVEDLSEADKTYLVAQARFLRGFYYYLITMYHGDAPLDFGSGKLKFNLTPTTTSVRNPREEVLGCIIDDFDYASKNLPDKAEQVGRAAKGAALHFLAKAYLTRAGLYETNRESDYASAYETAMELINNQAKYGTGLTEDFAQINLEGNESAPEVLFTVQRTWSSAGPNMEFEETNDGPFAVTNKGNRANFFFTAGYENVKVAGGTAIVPRSTFYQRPWRMFVPTKWLIEQAFADKENDARWDGSFRMSWDAGVKFTVKGRTVNVGEKAIEITFDDNVTAEANDSVSESGNGVIYKPHAVYMYKNLYDENGFSRENAVEYIYPNLTKFDDTKRQNMNYDSNRPYIVARLAETYLIAAEAAYYNTSKGGAEKAAELINVIRERAAYRAGLTDGELATRKSAMDITADDVDIDFILDERSREFCGESLRFFDLVRTGKYVERVEAHNPFAKGNVKEYHTLRPIPQTQIDLLSDPAQKEVYQNPGY